MAVFEPKPWVLCNNVNFLTFWTSCFHSLERRYLVLEYRKRHFVDLYCLKEKVGKMAVFERKPWVLCNNVNFLSFWTSCFHSLERRYLVLEYRKRHFVDLYCLKEKVGKMAVFEPKPWVNPFWKMLIFLLLELPVFKA